MNWQTPNLLRSLKSGLGLLSLMALALPFTLSATAHSHASADRAQQEAMIKFQQKQSEYAAQEAANRLKCPSGYSIIRVSYRGSMPGLFQCNPVTLGMYPECQYPFETAAQICVYAPKSIAPVLDAREIVKPEVAIAEAVEQLSTNFTTNREVAEIFINVNKREKSLGKYLKTTFENSGRVTATPWAPTSTPALPNGGLMAYSNPGAASAARTSPDEKIIPLALNGKLSFISLSSLVYVRDRLMRRRFGPALAVNSDELEKQKLVFLDEIVAHLQVTGYLDDNYPVISGNSAKLIGCSAYGNAQFKLIDPTVINVNDGEIAFGRKAKNAEGKKAASVISYWYKSSGVAPFTIPAQPTGDLDEDVIPYINKRFITCEKLPSLNDLPILAKVAPHFLSDVTGTVVHTTARDMHAWHWTNTLNLTEDATSTPLANEPKVAGYLEANWRKFYFQPGQGDNVGNGFYLALTPATTRHIGDAAIDLQIPKGTRFIALNSPKFALSPEANTELAQLGCVQPGSNLVYFFKGSSPACLNVARALVRQQKISMAVYTYITDIKVDACSDASTPGWSLVVYDPDLMTPSHVTLFNFNDRDPMNKFNTEQRMIAEYLRQAPGPYGAPSYKSATGRAIVAPNEFSKWVNTEILGCGMGREWTSSWQ